MALDQLGKRLLYAIRRVFPQQLNVRPWVHLPVSWTLLPKSDRDSYVEGTYYAIADTCTQASGPLSEGEVQGTKVSCPWHGADFDLKTGAVLGPPAYEAVSSYKVVVEGDDIKVEV